MKRWATGPFGIVLQSRYFLDPFRGSIATGKFRLQRHRSFLRSLFSFGRYAGLPTAMRLVGDPANFPDIVLGPPKDGIYISVDRSGWMALGCSH